MKKTLTTKKEVQKKDYKVSVSFNGTVQSFETDNLVESILKMNLPVLKTKIIFTVERNNKKTQKYMFIREARKVFSNKLSTEFFTRNIEKSLA